MPFEVVIKRADGSKERVNPNSTFQSEPLDPELESPIKELYVACNCANCGWPNLLISYEIQDVGPEIYSSHHYAVCDRCESEMMAEIDFFPTPIENQVEPGSFRDIDNCESALPIANPDMI